MPDWCVLEGDARRVLALLEPNSVHCAVTSPPYFGLRDYKIAPARWSAVEYQMPGGRIAVEEMECCLGNEPTPDAYVGHLVAIFRALSRALRDDGLVFLNLGDGYASQGGAHGGRDDNQRGVGAKRAHDAGAGDQAARVPPDGCKAKDMIGIPWLVAFALRADGWYLRNDIVWKKPNVMPASLKDRFVSSTEHIFMLSKSKRYYFDWFAAQEVAVGKTAHDLTGQGYSAPGQVKQNGNRSRKLAEQRIEATNGVITGGTENSTLGYSHAMRRGRDVWSIPTVSFKEMHFAVFPPALVERAFRAGSPEAVCSTCGRPWARSVATAPMVIREGPKRQSLKDAAENGTQRTAITGTMLAPAVNESEGFAPACNCGSESVPSIVLDPFTGSGTTGMVARQMGRSFIGIEASAEFSEMARRRIKTVLD